MPGDVLLYRQQPSSSLSLPVRQNRTAGRGNVALHQPLVPEIYTGTGQSYSMCVQLYAHGSAVCSTSYENRQAQLFLQGFSGDVKVALERLTWGFQRAQEDLSYQQHAVIKGITSSLHQSDSSEITNKADVEQEQKKDRKRGRWLLETYVYSFGWGWCTWHCILSVVYYLCRDLSTELYSLSFFKLWDFWEY